MTLEHAEAAAYGQAFADHGTLAAAQLKAIGMNIKDQPLPYAQYISTVYQGKYEGIGMAGRAIYYWMDYPTEQFTMKPKRGRINLSDVNDPDLEALLDKQRGQFNMEERIQTIRRIEELVAEEQYQVYFSTDTRSYFWDPALTNYRATAWYPYTHLMKAWRDDA
jgi:ABC-type transport system substrate-binding protein